MAPSEVKPTIVLKAGLQTPHHVPGPLPGKRGVQGTLLLTASLANVSRGDSRCPAQPALALWSDQRLRALALHQSSPALNSLELLL